VIVLLLIGTHCWYWLCRRPDKLNCTRIQLDLHQLLFPVVMCTSDVTIIKSRSKSQSYSRTEQKANSLFTPPTWTRQNCHVLSCACQWCEHKLVTGREKTVLSCFHPVSNLQLFRVSKNLEIGNWVETKLMETG